MAAAAARSMGINARVEAFDGSSGVSDRFFSFLAREHCSLVMGYPVDSVDPDPPHGLALTHAYLHTGYVLATLRHARSLAQLPPGTSVSVSTSTVPDFYLVGALGSTPRLAADVFLSQEDALDALVRGKDRAAMLWAPSVVRYERQHPGIPRIVVSPLPIPHAKWSVAALYAPSRAAFARRFNTALATIGTNGTLTQLTQRAGLEAQ